MIAKRKNSKSPTDASANGRSGGVRSLAALLPRVTRPILGRRGFAEANIITEWATIIGTNLARICHPEKLAFPKGKRIDGVLHVRVVGGAATELQHLEPQVVERINAYFGYAAVGRLKLLHTPPIGPVTTPRQPIADKGGMGRLEPPLLSQKQTDTIKNSELRNALENLGRAIVTRSRR